MVELIGACWVLMEIFSSFLFADSLMQRKTWNRGTHAAIMAVYIGLFLFANYYTGNIPIILAYISAYTILSFLCYNAPWHRRAAAILLSVIPFVILDTFSIYRCTSQLGFHPEDFFVPQYTYLTASIINRFAPSFSVVIGIGDYFPTLYRYLAAGTISKALALLIAWLFFKLRSGNSDRRIQIRWLILTLLFPLISLIMLAIVYDSLRHDIDRNAKTLGFLCAVILGNICIIYMIYKLEKGEKEKQRMALLNQQMEIQTQSILALEKSYRAQRAASHEFSHHLNTIHTLLESKQYDTLSRYVHQLQETQTVRLFSINSHHAIVDAILNQKFQLAQEKGIDMQVKVNDLSAVTISTEALVVVLSNILDNAIEACVSCDTEKTIQFSMVVDKAVFLTVYNTSNPVSFVNGKIPTTKKGREDHGYGIDNTKKVLSGLHADYTFRYRDGWFEFVAEIPLS